MVVLRRSLTVSGTGRCDGEEGEDGNFKGGSLMGGEDARDTGSEEDSTSPCSIGGSGR